MHRNELLARLAAYRPVDRSDQLCVQRFAAFVRAHPDCFERTCAPGHVTGAAWIVDPAGERVLLTHHRKLGLWIQPGGHADGDPDVLAVALREAHEETGLEALRLAGSGIFDLDIHPIPARGAEPEHLHYDVRFAFVAGRPDALVVSAESFDLAWVALDALEAVTTEPSLLRMRDKWRAGRR